MLYNLPVSIKPYCIRSLITKTMTKIIFQRNLFSKIVPNNTLFETTLRKNYIPQACLYQTKITG